jgi:hypothetical protein
MCQTKGDNYGWMKLVKIFLRDAPLPFPSPFVKGETGGFYFKLLLLIPSPSRGRGSPRRFTLKGNKGG